MHVFLLMVQQEPKKKKRNFINFGGLILQTRFAALGR